MFFGKAINPQERVLSNMLDNMQRDPEVSLRTLLGNDEAVMNLRPNDKSKFIKIKKPRRERSAVEKKMYFKTLEQNLKTTRSINLRVTANGTMMQTLGYNARHVVRFDG